VRQLGCSESDAQLRKHIDGFNVVGGIQYTWDIKEPADLKSVMEAYKRTGAKFLVSMTQAAYPGTEGLRMTVDEVNEARRHGFRVGMHQNLLRRERSPSLGDPGYVEWLHDFVKNEVTAIGSDFLFFDGCQAPSSYFKTPELIAWFYNQADAKGQEVWINEDLGTDTRESDKFGDIIEGEGFTVGSISPKLFANWDTLRNEWTCWVNEFGIHKRDGSKWEWFYRDPADLLQVFIYNVSMGGFWCVQMVNTEKAWNTMYEIGDWLAVNGEAIYDTRPFGEPNAEYDREPKGSKPVIEGKPKQPTGSGHWMWRFEQTVDVAQMKGPWYYTSKGQTVYAIHWGEPGKSVTIPNVTAEPGSSIHMLGSGKKLEWRQKDADIVLSNVPQMDSKYACSFVITMNKLAANPE
jgi:alpha-L-fucosidase